MPQIVNDNPGEMEAARKLAEAFLSDENLLSRYMEIEGALLALPVFTSPVIPKDVAYLAEQRVGYQDLQSIVKINFS